MRKREWLDVGIASGLVRDGNVKAVDLAEVAGRALFVPGYWWKGEKNRAARTQKLPGLEGYKRGFQLGWNEKVTGRRPKVAALVKALAKT